MSIDLIITTCETAAQANQLAEELLESRLAACIQIDQINSLYRWQGKIAKEPEYRLSIKADSARYKDIEAYLLRAHPYDLPEIICIPVAHGSSDYIAWVVDQTN